MAVIDDINTLITNYTLTWEYEGVTIVLDEAPSLNFVNSVPVIECSPYFYIDESLITLGENVYPFQWMNPGRFIKDYNEDGEDDPDLAFQAMVNTIINNPTIWQR